MKQKAEGKGARRERRMGKLLKGKGGQRDREEIQPESGYGGMQH